MKLAHPLCMLAVGISLAGFAATKDKDLKVTCAGPTCATTVTIQSCKDYKVSTDPIVVAKGNKPVMRWTLATPGWTFTGDGIDIRKAGAEFEGKLKESGTSFKWKNRNSKADRYKYDIVATDGKQTCRYDPWIVNQ